MSLNKSTPHAYPQPLPKREKTAKDPKAIKKTAPKKPKPKRKLQTPI